MRTLLLIAALLLTGLLHTSSARAQIVNTQPLLGRLDGDGLSCELNTNLEWRTGNVELFRLSASALIAWRSDAHALLSSSSIELGDRAGERFLFRTFTHLRYQYRLDDILTFEIFGQVAHDEFRRITVRGLGGLGARLALVTTDETRLRLGLAYMFEHERFADSSTFTDTGEQRDNHRASVYLDLRHDLAERLGLGVTVFYQPRLDAWSDWQLAVETRLAVHLTKSLALTLQLHLAYDTTPPDGVETLDTATLVGLGWSF
jgi:putative salt-induced outer membrane protein YdiY